MSRWNIHHKNISKMRLNVPQHESNMYLLCRVFFIKFEAVWIVQKCEFRQQQHFQLDGLQKIEAI